MATQKDVEKWKAAFIKQEQARVKTRERMRAYLKTPKGIAYTKRTQASKRYKAYHKNYYQTVTKRKRK